MTKKLYVAAITLGLMLPMNTLAENVPTMDEVVVTATKTVEKRKDVPNAVILIDEMDISESPARGVGELLSNELGVDWRTRGNYGGAAEELHLRGMSGEETQLLINGVRANSPSLGSANVGILPLNNIERIEVVKGAGSLLYGSGAMAGTVSVFTKSPKRDVTDIKVRAGYGTEDTYELSAEQGMFLRDDFGYYLTASKRETDGFRDNGDLDHNDASLKLVMDKGDMLSVSLYGDYIDREFGVPGVKPSAGTSAYSINGVAFYNDDSASLLNEGGSEDAHVVLSVDSQPLDWFKLHLETDYAYIESYNLERYNADGWTTSAGEGLKTWVTNKVSRMEGNFEVKPFSGASLLFGADYEQHDWDTKNITLDVSGNDTASVTTNNAALNTKGGYIEAQYRPIEPLKLLAGIRQESHSTFGYENIPHFGLVFNPFQNTVVKASHGKFFKAPTPNDLFWPEDDGVRGNPNLDAETGWHSDVTLEQEFFDDEFFVSLTYFEWDVDNKIEWAENPSYPGPWGNKWTPTNLNKSNGKGWEVGTKFDPSPEISFSFSYTYSDAEDETPTLIRKAQYVPKHTAKAGLTYRSTLGLVASLTTRYVSDRDFYRSSTTTTPTDILDSYIVTDFKVEQRLQDSWLVSLYGNNVFEKGYDTYVGSFIDQTATRVYSTYPSAGRSFFVSLTYEF